MSPNQSSLERPKLAQLREHLIFRKNCGILKGSTFFLRKQMVYEVLRQFGPKTNSDRKPDSDQRQIRTQF